MVLVLASRDDRIVATHRRSSDAAGDLAPAPEAIRLILGGPKDLNESEARLKWKKADHYIIGPVKGKCQFNITGIRVTL